MVQHVKVPANGAKITVNRDFTLNVPDNPIIPYIEGDGTGFDITPVMIKVVDAAVAKAYAGKRRIHWMEIYAGEKSTKVYGPDVWLPDETLKILREYVVSIKGPLTTPVGGGIRSLNVALRQELDLYVCLRPVRWFKGVPSPVKDPAKIDMVIFRENSEDIYAGIEWEAGSANAKKIIDFLVKEMGVKKIRFPAWFRFSTSLYLPCSECATSDLSKPWEESTTTSCGGTSSRPHSRSITAATCAAWSSTGQNSIGRPSGPRASGTISPWYFFITSR